MSVLIKHCYKISILLFLIYIANIIVGKVSMAAFDRQLPLGLNGVLEFSCLLFACLFFVVGILRTEANENAQASNQQTN